MRSNFEFVSENEPSTSQRAVGTPAPLDDSGLLDAYSKTVSQVVRQVSPSVVNIEIRKTVPTRRGPQESHGGGSGFIFTPDGLP